MLSSRRSGCAMKFTGLCCVIQRQGLRRQWSFSSKRFWWWILWYCLFVISHSDWNTHVLYFHHFLLCEGETCQYPVSKFQNHLTIEKNRWILAIYVQYHTCFQSNQTPNSTVMWSRWGGFKSNRISCPPERDCCVFDHKEYGKNQSWLIWHFHLTGKIQVIFSPQLDPVKITF